MKLTDNENYLLMSQSKPWKKVSWNDGYFKADFIGILDDIGTTIGAQDILQRYFY